MPFSDALKEARKKAHISQRDLAKMSGVSQQAISCIESGTRSPSESTMQLLSAALGYSMPQLMDNPQYFPDSEITPEERHLIALYRDLNQAGREFVRQTIYTAASAEIYKKRDPVPGVEDALTGSR